MTIECAYVQPSDCEYWDQPYSPSELESFDYESFKKFDLIYIFDTKQLDQKHNLNERTNREILERFGCNMLVNEFHTRKGFIFSKYYNMVPVSELNRNCPWNEKLNLYSYLIKNGIIVIS